MAVVFPDAVIVLEVPLTFKKPVPSVTVPSGINKAVPAPLPNVTVPFGIFKAVPVPLIVICEAVPKTLIFQLVVAPTLKVFVNG